MVEISLRLEGATAGTVVTGNTFTNSGTAGHIGVAVFEGNLDIGAIIGANSLDASSARIGIFPVDDEPKEITGTEHADLLFDFVGTQAQTLHGGGGNDRLAGGGQNDILDGGAGIDQVAYAGVSRPPPISASSPSGGCRPAAPKAPTSFSTSSASMTSSLHGDRLHPGRGGRLCHARGGAGRGAAGRRTILVPSTPTAVTDGDANDRRRHGTRRQRHRGRDHGAGQRHRPGAGPVTYSLTDSAGGRFAIDALTGVVIVANGLLLDFEAATSHDDRGQGDQSTAGVSSEQTFTVARAPM